MPIDRFAGVRKCRLCLDKLRRVLGGNPQAMSCLANALLDLLEDCAADSRRIGTVCTSAELLDLRGEAQRISCGFSEHGPKQRCDEFQWRLVVVVKDDGD